MGNFDKNRFQSTRQTYETPNSLFAPLDKEFQFTLDVAADSTNSKCKKFISETQDALKQNWSGVCWCNPPYNQLGKWVRKAFTEAQEGRATTVMLIPSRTNTEWWHDYCNLGEIRFVRGRPKFVGCTHGLPQPLALVIFKIQSLMGGKSQLNGQQQAAMQRAPA